MRAEGNVSDGEWKNKEKNLLGYRLVVVWLGKQTTKRQVLPWQCDGERAVHCLWECTCTTNYATTTVTVTFSQSGSVTHHRFTVSSHTDLSITLLPASKKGTARKQSSRARPSKEKKHSHAVWFCFLFLFLFLIDASGCTSVVPDLTIYRRLWTQQQQHLIVFCLWMCWYYEL